MDDKYLIKNSTKEERVKRVNGAIAVSMLDSKEPSNEVKKLFQKYIDGEMDIDEILKKTIEEYKEIDDSLIRKIKE